MINNNSSYKRFVELMDVIDNHGASPQSLYTNLKNALACYVASPCFTQLPQHKREQIAIEHQIILSIAEALIYAKDTEQ